MRSHYRLAIRTYPADYRRDYGEELLDTARELGSARWSFRQARSLFAGGLRTRAWLACRGSAQQLWASGIALALALWSMLGAANLIAIIGLGGNTFYSLSPWIVMLTYLVPLAALTITTRWPTALLLTARALVDVVDAIRIRDVIGAGVGFGDGFVISALVSLLVVGALSWWLALRSTGERALSPRTGLAFLVLMIAITVIVVHPGEIVLPLIWLGLPIVGLLLAAVDPRALIATTILWLFFLAARIPIPLVESRIESPADLLLPFALPLAVTAALALVSHYGVGRVTNETRAMHER